MTDEHALGFPLREKADRGSGQVLNMTQVSALVEWAGQLQLRADLGHVCLMYGVPYPTVDGLMYHARRQDPEMRYVLSYWDPQMKERIGLSAADYAVECIVYNGKGEQVANRLGIVRADELTEMSSHDTSKLRYPIVSKKSIEMAENRALWDALSDAYPLGIEKKAEGVREERDDRPV